MSTKFRVRRVDDGWRVHMPHYPHLNLTVETWDGAIGQVSTMVSDLQRDASDRAELGLVSGLACPLCGR